MEKDTELTCFVDSGSAVTIIKSSIANQFIEKGDILRKCNTLFKTIDG